MKEKTLKDVHPGIREFYNRAVDFERKENWEFAISCMLETVLRVPAFNEARTKLREYEKQFTKKLKGIEPILAQVKGFLALPKIKKLTVSSPIDAVSECEKILAFNLNNPVILQALADAALKADAANIAIEALLILHDYQPGNIAVMRKLANCYRQDGQAQEALKVYQYLASKNPKDKKILESFQVSTKDFYKDKKLTRNILEKTLYKAIDNIASTIINLIEKEQENVQE